MSNVPVVEFATPNQVAQIIVSRHRAAVEFIASLKRTPYTNYTLDLDGQGNGKVKFHLVEGVTHPEDLRNDDWPEDISVLSSATADDVRGKIVYGNLPLHLACLCQYVIAIEFSGAPPRGQEYTLTDMVNAGAKLERYKITRV